MIDSNTVAAHLVRALITDGIAISDPDQAQAVLATVLAPVIGPAATLAQIDTDVNVPLETELRIEVELTPEQTEQMGQFHDAQAAAGKPIPGPRPGPLNQPTHDLSDEDITLGTLVNLKAGLRALSDDAEEA